MEGKHDMGNWSRFSVHPGEERFLVVHPRPESYPARMRIVTGWAREQGLMP